MLIGKPLPPDIAGCWLGGCCGRLAAGGGSDPDPVVEVAAGRLTLALGV